MSLTVTFSWISAKSCFDYQEVNLSLCHTKSIRVCCFPTWVLCKTSSIKQKPQNAQCMQVRRNGSSINNSHSTLHIIPQHHHSKSKANKNCERFHYLRCSWFCFFWEQLCFSWSSTLKQEELLYVKPPLKCLKRWQWLWMDLFHLKLVFVINRKSTANQHNPFSQILMQKLSNPGMMWWPQCQSYWNTDLDNERSLLKTTLKRQSVTPVIKDIWEKTGNTDGTLQIFFYHPGEPQRLYIRKLKWGVSLPKAFHCLSPTTSLLTSFMQTDSSDTWCSSNKGCTFTLNDCKFVTSHKQTAYSE